MAQITTATVVAPEVTIPISGEPCYGLAIERIESTSNDTEIETASAFYRICQENLPAPVLSADPPLGMRFLPERAMMEGLPRYI